MERATEIPAESFVDRSLLERERIHVFRAHPLLVGHASALQRAGDFVTHEATGIPLVLVRRDDGELAAYVNVCRHRGTRVECAKDGAGKKDFVCPYHGWTYGLDGKLLHIPDGEGSAFVKKENMGLIPVPITRQFGFLWVFLRPGAALDVARFLGPVASELERLDLGSRTILRSTSFERKLNWKLAIDRLLAAERDVHFVFPNTLLLAHAPYFSVWQVFPRTVDESAVFGCTLVLDPPPCAERSLEVLEASFDAEFTMGESIQSGLRSGTKDLLSFAFEPSLEAFHAALDAALAAAAPPAAPAPIPLKTPRP